MSVNDLATKIEQNQPLTEKERVAAGKVIRAFGQVFYDQSGVMFICGSSKIGTDGLPDMIQVCPSYGADIRSTGVYMRKDLS